MYFFKFFRNQLWQHLIRYNSFTNVNINKIYISCIVFLQISFCFLFVDIYVREDVWTLASHLHVFCFQLEAGVKGLGLGGVKVLGIVGGGGVTLLGVFLLGGSVPHHLVTIQKFQKMTSLQRFDYL